MIRFALLGKNISHSKSKIIYQKFLGDVSYQLLDFQQERDIPSLVDIFEKHNILALNITAPYKDHFLDQVHGDDFVFKQLKSINCIKKQGNFFGATNTDFWAMKRVLDGLIKKKDYQFVLLGNGAMARMTLILFNEFNLSLGSTYFHYYREKDGPIENLNLKKELKDRPTLIINACSRGFVFGGEVPLHTCFWDYNYSYPPHQKKFNHYIDGYNLLFWQARYALDFIFNR